jgi:hypothetical protein
MNNLYFACADCKIYIDAGYRWAYWKLEHAGVVSKGLEVRINAVLAAQEFWNPPREEDSRRLYEEIFPPLHQFLLEHQEHKVIFDDSEAVPPEDEREKLDWMEVGYSPEISPRYLVEVLGFREWQQVEAFMAKQRFEPNWYEARRALSSPGIHARYERGKQKFIELVDVLPDERRAES